jgi:hypothetical protein
MTDTFDQKLAELQRLSATQLRLRYAELFGEPTRTGNKPWLVKRLAWRLQSLAEGDLSDRARQRAAELANDADLRLSPPRARPHRTSPGPETEVLQHGFEYQGQVFASLSAVAKQITGTHCNGFWFFHLGRYNKGANS